MTELKRAIFVRYANGGSFQFTRDGNSQQTWLLNVTSPDGQRYQSGYVDRAFVERSMRDGNQVDQYD